VEAASLPDLSDLLRELPAIVVDHLGLRQRGVPHLLRLVERGAWVKASEFGRMDFPAADVLRQIARAHPHALIFGTDIPGTRAPRP
jgi:hypothetical protein